MGSHPSPGLETLVSVFYLVSAAMAVVALWIALVALRARRQFLEGRARREERLAQWREAFLTALFGDSRSSELLERVAREDAMLFIDFLNHYSRRLTGEVRESIGQLAAPWLDTLMRRVELGDATQRARAADTLASLMPLSDLKPVVAALEDPAPLVSMAAARALCATGRLEHLVAVVERLDRFHHWSPQLLAATLAGPGGVGLPLLRQKFADPGQPMSVRATAGLTLVHLNDVHSADTAAEIIRSEEDRELLVAALRLLGACGRTEHGEAVRRAASSPDDVVRIHAMTALARLGGPVDRARLRLALDDPSIWVAIAAAQGLADNGGRGLLEQMAPTDHPRAELVRQVLSESGAL